MNVTEKKLQAAEDFRNRILSSKVGKDIVRIILFGSVLREEAHADSDIDLLLVTFNSIKEMERVALTMPIRAFVLMGSAPLVISRIKREVVQGSGEEASSGLRDSQQSEV